MPAKLTDEQFRKKLFGIHGDSYKAVGRYKGMQEPLKFKCGKCGESKIRLAVTALRQSKPDCCSQAPTHQSYLDELKALGSSLEPLEKYRGRWGRLKHRCRDCGNVSPMMPKHILRGHGCFICAKDRQSTENYKRKVIRAGGRTHSLQGREPQALSIMKTFGIKASEVVSSVSDGKPVIEYQFHGAKKYLPDFFLPKRNMVVEVKSTWTLGMTRPDRYEKNVAKARATLSSGYDYAVVLVFKNGSGLALPIGWHEMNSRALRELIGLEV